MKEESQTRKPDRRYGRKLAGGLVLLAAAGALLLWGGDGPLGRVSRAGESSGPLRGERLYTVKAAPVASYLTLSGIVEAGNVIPVPAPFDGVVRQRHVSLGAWVEKETLLVSMDTGEVANRLREAQSAWLKARMEAEVLSSWESGPEMARVRRLHVAAVATLASTERQVNEAKALFDRGIIARSEYDSLVQQLEDQKRTVDDALQDLEETRRRGGPEYQEVARLELQNARSRLDDLEAQYAGADIRAVTDGILVRPPVDSGGAAERATVETGGRLTMGQTLFMIADTASFIIRARVDEIDVNRVQPGQTVAIDSDAFSGATLEGTVIDVSAEAVPREGNLAPSFEIRARFPVVDETLRRRIRIGMSARMTILLYENETALLVPVQAVQGGRSDPYVRVRDNQTGVDRTVSVATGVTNEKGVEILSGLTEGDTVLLLD